MKKIVFISLLFCFAAALSAQVPGIEKMKPGQLKSFGKAAMSMRDYFSAVEYYEAYLKYRPEDDKIYYQLAEAYRYSRNYAKAAEYYEKAIAASPDKYELAPLYHGLMLQANGEFAKAREILVKFRKTYEGEAENDPYKKEALVAIAGCDLGKYLRDTIPMNMAIKPLGPSINKAHMEFSPVILGDSSLLYASLKSDTSIFLAISEDSVNVPARKFYLAEKAGGSRSDKGEYPGPFNDSTLSTGNGAFSPDGNKFYFTKCKVNKDNKSICSIYISERVGGTWQEPQPLSELINDPKFTSTQPTMGIEKRKDLPDREVLYFVSDREEGKGGLDIWYSVYDAKKKEFKAPKNVRKLNTGKDDMTPYYDNDTRNLYFSSDGRPGLGGLDIYKSSGQLSTWDAPENVGFPVNSGADDLYYVLNKNKEQGFLVSNRQGGTTLKNSTCCDDIYEFAYLKYVRLAVAGTVLQTTNDTFSMDPSSMKTMDNGMVTLYKMSDEKIPILITSVPLRADGKYLIDLEQGYDYKVVFSRDSFFNKEVEMSTKKSRLSDTTYHDFISSRLPDKDKPILLKNIEYEFNSFELTPTTRNTIDTTLLLVMNENPDLIIELGSHTDSKGQDNFNMSLSQKRAQGVVKYLITKGISIERLIAKGYGETLPIAPNENKDGSDNPDGRQKNRRTEFKIVGKLETKAVEEE